MVGTAAQRAMVPGIDDIEHQRLVDADRRMQTIGRLPSPVADAGDVLTHRAGRVQRHAAAVAGDDVAAVGHSRDFDLQPLDRTVDVPHRGSDGAFLAQHVPGLQRGPQFQMQAPVGDLADLRETEFPVGQVPGGFQRESGVARLADHIAKILPHEMRQHEPVVQRRLPRHQRRPVRLVPEPGDQRPQQQLLSQTHAGMRRHLERAELDQPQAARGRIGRVELVDAEFGAVRVAGHVDQQVAEDAVDQPRRAVGIVGHLLERDLQFVQRVAASFVHTRRLAGRAQERTREQVRQAGMVLPVGDQAAQQVRTPQERAVRRRASAQQHMVPAPRARVPAVQIELLGAQTGQPGFLVQCRGVLDQILPTGRRVDVHLDHAGVGRDLDVVDPRIERRRVAFDHHRRLQGRRRVLDRRNQLQERFAAFQRRQEHVQLAVARLDAQRGPHDLAGLQTGRRRLRGPAGSARLHLEVLDRRRVASHPGRRSGQRLAQFRRTRQRPPRLQRVLRKLADARVGARRQGDRLQRQTQSDGRIARDQHQPFRTHRPSAAAPPRTGLPPLVLQRQHATDRLVQTSLEHASQPRPFFRILQLGILRVHVDRQTVFAPQVISHILMGRQDASRIDAQPLAERFGERLGRVDRVASVVVQSRQQVLVAPQWLPVGSPVAAERPARQRFARIPLALPVMQHAARSEPFEQPPDQLVGQTPLVLAQRRRPPRIALHVVDRHKGRFAAHRQTHVAGGQMLVDQTPDRQNRRPLLVRVGLGHARVFVNALDRHRMDECRLALLDAAGDRSRAARIGRTRQRNVAFAGQQPRRGIETDPAGTGQVHLGPGVQIREIRRGAGRTVQRLDVGHQLHQIARDEARGQTQMTKHLDQQPARIAARARTSLERLFARLHARLQADQVADQHVQLLIQADQEIDRLARRPIDRTQQLGQSRPNRLGL